MVGDFLARNFWWTIVIGLIVLSAIYAVLKTLQEDNDNDRKM